ncbi:MAG: GWxTD domain-containing protein [Candidatus Neomarinimicrobiota bacterium]
MKKVRIIFLIFFGISSLTYSQKFSRTKKIKTNVEKYVLASFIDVVNADSVRIVVFMEIPYHSLQFIKKDEIFLSYYQASIGIRKKKDKDADYFIFSDSIKVNNYSDTRSVLKNRKHFAEFTIPIGFEYVALGELQDLDTRKKGTLASKINLKSSIKKPYLLKPIFMLDLPGYWGFEANKIPTRGFRVREIGDGVDLKISGFVNKGRYDVNIFLLNEADEDSLIQKFGGDGDYGFFSENIFIPSSKFNSLKNNFKISLIQNKKNIEEEISFSRYRPGMSNYVYDVELAIKQMRYILSTEENKNLKNASKADREKLFYNFWKRRNPSKNKENNKLMEEYYERVEYTNEQFSGWQPGWETDRGMIYILFGPPDQIQRSNPVATNSTIYQIWNYYKINKEFIFRDQNGFGDYRLETPFFGFGS